MSDIADWMTVQAMTDAEPWFDEEWEAEDAALEQGPPEEDR